MCVYNICMYVCACVRACVRMLTWNSDPCCLYRKWVVTMTQGNYALRGGGGGGVMLVSVYLICIRQGEWTRNSRFVAPNLRGAAAPS